MKAIVCSKTKAAETHLGETKHGVYRLGESELDEILREAKRKLITKMIVFLNNEEEASDLGSDSSYSGYTKQSGIARDKSILKLSSSSTQQNVKFADQMSPYTYNVESTMDPTRTLMDTDDATLENFFSRPLKIFETEWGTGTNLFTTINPWRQYFNNPRVVNRIANYNLMRCKLHIKIVINGNGFQYGRAIASYLPFAAFDTLTRDSGVIRADLVQTSQLPHVYLDPTTSTGGDMVLPYFDFKNNMDVVANSWNDMGDITLRSINSLKHANGASDKATISVFAWAEDMHMSVLTSVEPGTLGPQSGEEIDEANLKGMISGPATAVAKAAGALKIIPQIAPFAVATETGASMVAKIAKSLGYCRPPQTKDPEVFNPRPNSSLAVTTVPDAAHKLTVDDKQELSIDPRIAGLGAHDTLDIRSIASRESYLTTFSWAMGTAPETLLWNSRVDPVIWAEDGATPTGYLFPACAMAALPFRYWTGSMKFRFQIVCSSFHKGRLKIVYDPVWLETNEYNTNYLEIIDIADKTDFTIEVGNGQTTSLLTHHKPGLDSVTQMYSNNSLRAKEEGNGVVGVYVVNELTTPNSTANNDIEINVFVSMGEDFETFVPDDHFQKFVFKPQAGEAKDPDIAFLKRALESEDKDLHRLEDSVKILDAIIVEDLMQNAIEVNNEFKKYVWTFERNQEKFYNRLVDFKAKLEKIAEGYKAQSGEESDSMEVGEASSQGRKRSREDPNSVVEYVDEGLVNDLIDEATNLTEEYDAYLHACYRNQQSYSERLFDLRVKLSRIAEGYTAQSGVAPDSQNTEEPSAPVQTESDVVGMSQTNHELLNRVYTGESIKSFRALLKRYNLHTSLFYVPDGNRRVFKGLYGMFPYLRGNVSGAIHNTNLADPYNYCNTVLLHWVTMAHQGWRGGIRYKILPRGTLSTGNSVTAHIGRVHGKGFGANAYKTGGLAATLYSSDDDIARSVISPSNIYMPQLDSPPSGVNGTVYCQGSVNPTIEFEVPFYSEYRFKPGKQQNYTQRIDTEMWQYLIYTEGGPDTSYDVHVAAAEDFQVYMWTGLPPMYYEPFAPAPQSTR